MDIFIWVILISVAIFILSGIKVINQYERGVVLTLGRFTGIRQPGLRIVIPVFQKIIRVDVRSTPIDVPKQEIITKDNVTVGVDAKSQGSDTPYKSNRNMQPDGRLGVYRCQFRCGCGE